MGRKLRRVPAGFRWPLGEVWPGFHSPWVNCPSCKGRGQDNLGTECVFCDGLGSHPDAREVIDNWQDQEPPEGPWYQVWETVSDGSPISPAFATAEELAAWLAQCPSWGCNETDYETWLAWINGPGWAPSMVITSHGALNGVDGMVLEMREREAENG